MPEPTLQTVEYARGAVRGGDRPLLADVWCPPGDGPFDLVVWMHSGGFRTGTRQHPAHARIAAGFARHGYAMAFLDYRLARPPARLRRATGRQRDALIAQARAAGEEMADSFLGARPLAVVEDCCAFLARMPDWTAQFRLSGRIVLAGSSAGGISALNTLYLPSRLSLSRPPVASVFSFSGGFAYTGSLHPTGARILALHNPADGQVPVSSIRRLAATTPDIILLIESDTQGHGALTLGEGETLDQAIDRCVAFDRAIDPLALDIPAAQAG